MSDPLDPELLAAFLPEWDAAATALGTADAAATPRLLDHLRGMAGAFELRSLSGMLAAAEPLPEPFAPGALAGLATALRAQAARIAGAGADVPPPEEAAAPPQAPRQCRVLLVDDSAMMRRLLRESLSAEPAFAVVGEAANGRAALERMAALQPDLTLLDIEMPELDGIGALRAWSLTGPGAVVVVSSAARPGTALAAEARRLGAAAVVGKPSGAFSPDLRDRQGGAILRAARRAAGLPSAGEAG